MNILIEIILIWKRMLMIIFLIFNLGIFHTATPFAGMSLQVAIKAAKRVVYVIVIIVITINNYN